jgi:UDP-glucose 4-epimerase
MNILITGGSGFIGRNLVEPLTKNHKVLAPTHKELELLDENAVKNYLKKHKFDIVIHGAVRPGHRNAKDPSNQLYNNLRMFFNIIRNSESFGKMIFLSSGAVYDASKILSKVQESDFDASVPIDEHGFSKYIIAKHIEKSDNIVELRIFGIFGKYEDYAIRFISNAICKTIFDLPITIKQNRKFDYLFVDDLIPVIDYFIENKGGHKAYNITPDKAVDLLSLAEKVRKVSGNNLPIMVGNTTMGIEYSGDNSRLKNEMGYIKFTNIGLSIKKLYEWYFNNKKTINKKYLLIDK